jgi:hypothetical protein
MEKCCGSCKCLDVPLDKRGRRVVSKRWLSPCTVPIPNEPPLPDSIRLHRLWKWPPAKVWMRKGDGKNCLTYEARTRKKA